MKIPRWALCILVAGAHASAAFAADVKVLSSGAVKPLVMALAPGFERETGHKVVIDSDTAGGLMRRVRAGEAFDIVIVTRPGLDQLTQAGMVHADTAVPLARIGIGVAAKPGAPARDVSTVDGFRQALLDAHAIAYIDPAAGGSSGIYIARLFETLGLAEQIKPKAVLVQGGLSAQRLLDGQADLAIQQMSELQSVPGVTVLGPIPDALQNYTVYAGAVGTRAQDAAASRAFLGVLSGPAARASLPARGMQAP